MSRGRWPAFAVAFAAWVCNPDFVAAQFPTLGQTDTFQTNTLQNWKQGTAAPPSGLVVTSNGPGGAADLAMRITSTGGAGAGGRLIAFNQSQWVGNYVGAGVNTIEMDIKSEASNLVPVNMRVGFRTAGAGYVTSIPVVLTNDGIWRHISFSITDAAMTPLGAPAPFAAFFAARQGELRLFSAANANTFNGDQIAVIVTVDNIRASFTPVPEPGGLVAASVVLCGLVRIVRRCRKPVV